MGSVAERRCVNEQQCYHVRKLGLTEAVKLGATHVGNRCDKCRKAGIDARQDPPQEHNELIEAARQLLRSNVTEEDQIMPTLVAAAWADASPAYKSMRDKVIAAGSGSSLWDEMCYRFSVCKGLAPLKIRDGILIYYRPAIDVNAVSGDDKSVVKEILIEVYDRSVKREEVERFYTALLSRESLSCLAGRGVFAYQFRRGDWADLDDDLREEGFPPPEPDVLQLLVRPEKEHTLNPSFAWLVRPQLEEMLREQGKFPEPREVGAFYEMLRSLGHHPQGRGGGSSHKAQKLVLECVGCYLGGREALTETDKDERRRLVSETNRLVKQYVTEPCAEKIPDESMRIQARDLGPIVPQLERIEGQIRTYGAYLLNMTL